MIYGREELLQASGFPVLVCTVISSVILKKTTWGSGTGFGRKCTLNDERCVWPWGEWIVLPCAPC